MPLDLGPGQAIASFVHHAEHKREAYHHAFWTRRSPIKAIVIRQSKQHGTLSKAVEVKVFLPEIPIVGMGKFRARMLHKRFRPPQGRWLTEASVEDILENVNYELETEFSMCEFRLVELGFGRFNLIGSLKEGK